jgi:hypothetical protein
MSNKEAGVGYGRPPASTRFKPGQSGNPTGRKKNVPNFKTELIAELNETVSYDEDGHKGRYTRQRAVVKRLVDLAINGDIRAINAIVTLCQSSDGNKAPEEELDNDGDQIMNDHLEKELKLLGAPVLRNVLAAKAVR